MVIRIAFAALIAVLSLVTPAHAQEPVSTDPAGCAVVGMRAFETDDPCVSSLGVGARRTAPFHLDGGAYRVEWAMHKPGSSYPSIELYAADADDPSRWRLIVHSPMLASNGDAVDETYIYNVKPGAYYLNVDAPSYWLVRLYPITP